MDRKSCYHIFSIGVSTQYVYNSFGITSVVAPSARRIATRTCEDFRRHAERPSQVSVSGKASCIRPSGIPSSSLKNLCPFTSLLAVTGPVPRLSTHGFRSRILFLLFFFVSTRTRLLPLCFPSCPTLRAFSCPIPPLFPASVSIPVFVPAPIPVSIPFLHLLLCHPARIYPSPRAPDPLTSATCFRPLPSMAGPKSVDNGNSKAMAAAQGRGHVVQSIRAADRYLSSGE